MAGAYHARQQGRDAKRDLKLARLGYRVVRVSADLVRGNLGDNADDSKDSLYVTYLTQTGRAVAFVGVEW